MARSRRYRDERAAARTSEASAKPPEHPVLALQRAAGNRAVATRLLARETKPAPPKQEPATSGGETTVTIEGLGTITALSYSHRPGENQMFVTAKQSELSARLMRAAAEGKSFPTVVIVGAHVKLTLREVMITNYQISGGENPVDVITFDFKQIDFETDVEEGLGVY